MSTDKIRANLLIKEAFGENENFEHAGVFLDILKARIQFCIGTNLTPHDKFFENLYSEVLKRTKSISVNGEDFQVITHSHIEGAVKDPEKYSQANKLLRLKFYINLSLFIVQKLNGAFAKDVVRDDLLNAIRETQGSNSNKDSIVMHHLNIFELVDILKSWLDETLSDNMRKKRGAEARKHISKLIDIAIYDPLDIYNSLGDKFIKKLAEKL